MASTWVAGSATSGRPPSPKPSAVPAMSAPIHSSSMTHLLLTEPDHGAERAAGADERGAPEPLHPPVAAGSLLAVGRRGKLEPRRAERLGRRCHPGGVLRRGAGGMTPAMSSATAMTRGVLMARVLSLAAMRNHGPPFVARWPQAGSVARTPRSGVSSRTPVPEPAVVFCLASIVVAAT